MICPNCGSQNAENYRFCIKCGSSLDIANIPNNNQFVNIQQNNSENTNSQILNIIDDGNNESNSSMQPMNQNLNHSVNQNMNQTPTQPMNQNVNNSISDEKVNFVDYFKMILSFILKPFTALKEKKNKLNNIKNSAILAAIVSLVATIITLIKTIISTVRVTTGGFLSEPKTEWVWDNLKKVQFVKVIGMNLLIFLGIIFAIAAVYYIAGLIAKKQPVFSRVLGIAAISVVPMILCVLVLSPLLSMIYAPLGMGVTIVGAMCTLIIMYEAINNELLLEGNAKYYLNLVCLSILLIAGYYLYMKLFMVSLGNLNNIFNMLGK